MVIALEYPFDQKNYNRKAKSSILAHSKQNWLKTSFRKQEIYLFFLKYFQIIFIK